MKMRISTVKDLEVVGKKVLVRGDFDVDDGDNPRAESIRQIARYLQEKEAKAIRIIGHTDTKYDLVGELAKEFPEVDFFSGVRLDPREKENSMDYARELSESWEVYINESFAVSHRMHASLVSVPKVIREKGGQVGIGLRFEKEMEELDLIWEKTGKRILVIGGTKVEDKSRFAEKMGDRFSAVLKGGLLPGVDLRPDGLDISDATIENYVKIIAEAEVILAAGVMGKYEDQGAAKGTKSVLEAIANNDQAYKVAGGGDIEMAISSYGLTEKFDWISVGGGAMLEYIASGTLPGIEALVC
jgi:phosphoglycerate kinase